MPLPKVTPHVDASPELGPAASVFSTLHRGLYASFLAREFTIYPGLYYITEGYMFFHEPIQAENDRIC